MYANKAARPNAQIAVSNVARGAKQLQQSLRTDAKAGANVNRFVKESKGTNDAK
jgi:hypothetical protein